MQKVLCRIPKGEVVWVILIVSSMSLIIAQPVGEARFVVQGRPKGGGRFVGMVWICVLEGLFDRC